MNKITKGLLGMSNQWRVLTVIFALALISVSSMFVVFALTTTQNNNAPTANVTNSSSAVFVMDFNLSVGADVTHAGLAVTGGTAVTATEDADWDGGAATTDFYFYDAANGGAYDNATDWVGFDLDSDGVYTSAADTAIDCDGTGSAAAGACDAHTAGDALTAVETADNLCTDSATTPTIVFIDNDGTCVYNAAADSANILLGVPVEATDYGSPINGQGWAFVDAGGGAFGQGEDLYLENYAGELTYSAAADTKVAGANPAAGTAVADTKDADWTTLKFHDAATGGPWNAAADWIGIDTDGNNYYLDQLTAVTFDLNDAATITAGTDVRNITLYLDAGTAGYQGAGTDTYLGAATSYDSGGSGWAVSGLTRALSGGSNRLFAVAALDGNASNNEIMKVKVPSQYDAGTAGTWDAGDIGIFLSSRVLGNVLNTNSAQIDADQPDVINVTSPTANSNYNADDVITVSVVFNDAVTVTNTPRIELEMGTTDRNASYSAGSGTDTLNFTYTIVAGDTSSDLDYISVNSLTLNDGTIRDSAGNNAILTLAAPGAATSLGANKALVVDTTAQTVSSVTTTNSDGTFKAGAQINITVTFDGAVTVTGTPLIRLNSSGIAYYLSGSGTTELTFNYTVSAGDNTTDLSYNATTSLVLNSGTINDAAGNAATLTLPAPDSFGSAHAIVIDTTAPMVNTVSAAEANGNFKAGAQINITVTFNETVTVTGTPQLDLELGTTDRNATYLSGSPGTALTFNYTVASGDTSADLDYISVNSLTLNSGTIRDAVGNDAVLTLATPGATGSLGNAKALVIDTTAPTITSTSPANNAMVKTQVVSYTLSEAASSGIIRFIWSGGTADDNHTCTLQGTALNTGAHGSLTLATDANACAAWTALVSGANYTITFDANDSALNPATTVTVTGVTYDTTAPTISTIATTNANGSFKAGAQINITVAFTETVVVTGTPIIQLNSSGIAYYLSGSGTSTLTFNYTVSAGDNTTALAHNATGSLNANGGTITDVATTAATLTLPAPSAFYGAHAIVIDTTAPTFTMQYYSDSGLTTLLSDNTASKLKAGVYYINITSSEALSGTPTVSIAAQGDANDATNNATTSVSGNDYLYARIIVYDAAADGTVLEDISITGTDVAGNTATAASPSNEATKAQYTDTTQPTVVLTKDHVDAVVRDADTVVITATFTEAGTMNETTGILPNITLTTAGSCANISATPMSKTSNTVWTYSWNVPASCDGTTTVAITAQDVAGNANTAATGTTTYTVDNTAPIITATAPASATSLGSQVVNYTLSTAVASGAIVFTGTAGSDNAVVHTCTLQGTALNTDAHTLTLATDANACVNWAAPLVNNNNYTVTYDVTDVAGNAATTVTNTVVTYDTSAPAVTAVSSTNDNGYFKAGAQINITVTFGEAVNATGTPTLELETGTTNRNATYSSGSGTTVLTFIYTIQSGDTSSDLDYVSTSALGLNGGVIQDPAGNAASLTLVTPGDAGSLGNAKTLQVDTTAPTITATGPANNAMIKGATVNYTLSEAASSGIIRFIWAGGTADDNHTCALAGSALNTGEHADLTLVTGANSCAAWTALVSGANYTITFDANDSALNPATTVTVTGVTYDTTVPTVLNVTSTDTDGAYKADVQLNITIAFSEPVVVTGTPILQLNSSGIASYSSGTGTSNLLFTYTIGAGQMSSDLEYNATNSLALSGGTIRDAANNIATLTLASPGAATSLGANKALVVDTTNPTATVGGVSGSWVTSDNVTLDCSDAGSSCLTTVKYYYDADGSCSGDIATYTTTTTASSLNITADHNDYLCIWVNDTAGNTDTGASSQLFVDLSAPVATAANYTHTTRNLTLTFNDTMNGVTNISYVRIANSASGGEGFYLTATENNTCVVDNSVNINCTLSTAHRDMIAKWNATGTTTLYVTVGANAASDKASQNNIESNLTISGASWVRDTAVPTLSSFTYNFQIKQLVLTFSENVNSSETSAVNLSKMIIHTNSGAVNQVLDAATMEKAETTTVTLNFTTGLDNLMRGFADPRVDLYAGAVKDMSGNPIAEDLNNDITTSGVDTTAPGMNVTGHSYEYATKLLKMQFNETMDISATDVSKIVIADNPTLGNSVTLTGATAGTTDNTTVEVTLTDAQRDTIQGWNAGTIYVRLTAAAVSDIATNTNDALSTGLAVDTYIKKDQLYLKSGWNFISVPFTLSNTSVGQLGLSGGEVIYYYTSGYTWSQPTTLDALKGYLVYTTAARSINLTYDSTINATLPSITLSGNKWNMIGSSTRTSEALNVALNTTALGSEQAYDANKVYTIEDGAYGLTTTFRFARGYWVYMQATKTLAGRLPA